MEFLDKLQAWLKGTSFYNDFLLHMPAPLNNIYFETILFAVLLIYCGYRIIDIIRMTKRNRDIKKHEEELRLRLKEKAAENEIDRINGEKEARNQQDNMSQLMDVMKMSMLVNTTKQVQSIEQHTQPPQNFEQFREHSQQQNITRNRQKTQEVFDTIDIENNHVSVSNDNKSSVYDNTVNEFTKLENERITAELAALRIEKACMEQEYIAKEKAREAGLARIREAMEQKEREKQIEIERLSKALSTEKENSKNQIDDMINNLNIYKNNKEKEIVSITDKLATGSTYDRDEKQAEIDRLTVEMNSMKKMQEQAIAEKEDELARISAEKENQITDLTGEISNIRTKNNEDINQLTMTLQNAHAAQKAIEEAKAAEIEELNEELNRIKQSKEAEITTIIKEKEVSDFHASLAAAKTKTDELSQISQKHESEITKLQSELVETDASNTSAYAALNQQSKALKTEHDKDISDKQEAENKISSLNVQINEVHTSSQKQIIEKQAEINRLSETKIDDERVVGQIDKSITADKISTLEEKAVSQTSVPEPNLITIPKNIVKPVFGGSNSSSDTLSEFDKIIAQYEIAEAKSKALDEASKPNYQNIRTNKDVLEQ